MPTGPGLGWRFLSRWLLSAGLTTASAAAGSPTPLDQGAFWDGAARAAFYSTDQGSRIMPLAWFNALRQPDGTRLAADSLRRYGYLPNELSTSGLPIGFTIAAWQGASTVGMTCAACHTRLLTVAGADYRIDGGPALADFQGLLADIDGDVAAVLAGGPVLAGFANDVLGHPAAPAEAAALQASVQHWYGPYNTLMAGALPREPWGPGRLDAVGMILDRLTGLDIGKAGDGVIAANIRPADAPARYPFIWDAPRQDQTQWSGFADNGSRILGLSRNLGEVLGVFGAFAPRPYRAWPGVDFRSRASANWEGLDRLEKLVERIGPPRWPFALDQPLADAGRAVFERPPAEGGCAACHGIRPGVKRFGGGDTWATPVVDVGTDRRAHATLGWTVDTGALAGASIPFLSARLTPTDTAFNVLKVSVIGSILEHVDPLATARRFSAVPGLQGAFHKPPAAEAAASVPYEAKVLRGIWSAAPYLHNGSVPTLADLLTDPDLRPERFAVGAQYDLVKVGLARDQGTGAPVRTATGCGDLMSGISRCGHRFGTWLTTDEKRALLEYLKSL